jgi:hypothetical protein
MIRCRAFAPSTQVFRSVKESMEGRTICGHPATGKSDPMWPLCVRCFSTKKEVESHFGGQADPAAMREGAKLRERGPESEYERWAAEGLVWLASRNADGLVEKDWAAGHYFAENLSSLTSHEWKRAVRLCRRYQREIGPCP